MPLQPPNPNNLNPRRSVRKRKWTQKGKAYLEALKKQASTEQGESKSTVPMPTFQPVQPDVEARSGSPFREASSGDRCLPMTPIKRVKLPESNQSGGQADRSAQRLQSPFGIELFSPDVGNYQTLEISDRCLSRNGQILDFSDTHSSSTAPKSDSSDHDHNLWKGLNFD